MAEEFVALIFCERCRRIWTEEHLLDEVWHPDACGKCGGSGSTVRLGDNDKSEGFVWVKKGVAIIWEENLW